ncbi:hypothetical protein CSPX01_08223 [Colletotrichum filicis]|nr:hypothetical protein CSPX01_08223 [Colletotrichum filicis]
MLAIPQFVYFLSLLSFSISTFTLSMYPGIPSLLFYFSQTLNRGPGAKLSVKTRGAPKQDVSYI